MNSPDPGTARNADEHAGAESARPSTTGPPRWVKVSGVVVIALVLIFVILQLTGIGGNHGPGRHVSTSSLGDLAALSFVIVRGVHWPWP